METKLTSRKHASADEGAIKSDVGQSTKTFTRSTVRRAVQVLRSGSCDPDHAPLRAIYLSLPSTCHGPPTCQIIFELKCLP